MYALVNENNFNAINRTISFKNKIFIPRLTLREKSFGSKHPQSMTKAF